MTKKFIYAVLGGIFISIGAVAYMSVENKLAGSFMFSMGLFVIVVNGYNLFTGKAGYIFQNKFSTYIPFLALVWFGNLLGASATGFLMRLSMGDAFLQKASAIASNKMSYSFTKVFILAIFCNIMVVMAVEIANNEKIHSFARYVGLILCVATFVVAGFEHCVANMFYFALDNQYNLTALIYLLVATFGNVVGGVIAPLARNMKDA